MLLYDIIQNPENNKKKIRKIFQIEILKYELFYHLNLKKNIEL